jgi:hypothetical protein
VRIPGCPVRLYGADRVRETRTDAIGRLEFSDVPQGELELAVQCYGFKPRVIENIGPTDGDETLSVTLEILQMPWSCELWRVSLSYGSPTNDDKLIGFVVGANSGISSATITATNLGTGQKQSVTTDQRGKFHFAKLSPGKYSVTIFLLEHPESWTFGLWITEANQVWASISACEVPSLSYQPPAPLFMFVETERSKLSDQLVLPASPVVPPIKLHDPRRSPIARFFSAIGHKLGV